MKLYTIRTTPLIFQQEFNSWKRAGTAHILRFMIHMKKNAGYGYPSKKTAG
jgi:hypothetical protein